MKTNFILFADNLICKYNDLNKNELEKINYGLEGIYLSITKIIIMFFISIILKITKSFILILIFFNIIRYFSFGFHAKNSLQCLILSTLNFLVLPYFLLKINYSFNFYLFSLIFFNFVFLLFAPADTVKRPLHSKKKRIIRKSCTLILSIIYSIYILINNNYFSKILFISLMIEVILVNPLTYYIFSSPYNNYKKKA